MKEKHKARIKKQDILENENTVIDHLNLIENINVRDVLQNCFYAKKEEIATFKDKLRRKNKKIKQLKAKIAYAIQELKEFGSIEAVEELRNCR